MWSRSSGTRTCAVTWRNFTRTCRGPTGTTTVTSVVCKNRDLHPTVSFDKSVTPPRSVVSSTTRTKPVLRKRGDGGSTCRSGTFTVGDNLSPVWPPVSVGSTRIVVCRRPPQVGDSPGRNNKFTSKTLWKNFKVYVFHLRQDRVKRYVLIILKRYKKVCQKKVYLVHCYMFIYVRKLKLSVHVIKVCYNFINGNIVTLHNIDGPISKGIS